MDGSPALRIAPSSAEREQLVKEWLVAIIERTPLGELPELPLRKFAGGEVTDLVAAIYAALSEPGPVADPIAPERIRAEDLAALRSGPGAPARIGTDLGELQALILRRIERDHGGSLAEAGSRLAAIFGSIHGAVAAALLGAAPGVTLDVDPVTGFAGPAQLDHCLASLLAEQRRYGHPFALALVDIDGLGRINEAYGHDAGDRMLIAVAAILRRQLRAVDQAFRLEEDEFAIVAPHSEAEGLAAMARRVAQQISSSQSPDGPRIAIAAGVIDCPADGLSAERLLESAAEATYAAKASGAPVARSARGPRPVLQDP